MFSKDHCPLLQRKLSFFMKVHLLPLLSRCTQCRCLQQHALTWHNLQPNAFQKARHSPGSCALTHVWMVQVLFCSGVWSYVVASIATPTFILVPLLTIWFGIFPIVLSWWAALGLSIYYVATCGVSAPSLPVPSSCHRCLPLHVHCLPSRSHW